MRRWLAPLLAFLALALAGDSVSACQPPLAEIRIECSNQRFTALRSNYAADNRLAFSGYIERCAEDLSGLLPVLDRAVEQWYGAAYDYRYLELTRSTFMPYSPGLEQALLGQQGQLYTCTIPAFVRVGDWLQVWDVSRPYCTSPQLPTSVMAVRCNVSSLRPSLVVFIGFVFQHPSRQALPFLAALLLAAAIGIGTLAHQFMRRRLRAFVVPTTSKVAITLAFGALACCVVSPIDLLLVIGVAYFVVSAFLSGLLSRSASAGSSS